MDAHRTAPGRHRASSSHRRVRRVAATIVAALVVGAATTGSTSASFTDVARVRMAVQAGWVSCPTQVDTSTGPVTFELAVPGATGLIGLCSPSGVWWAYYQGDGNFVLYDMRTFTPTRTASSNGSRSLVLQADGDLVVVLADGQTRRTGTAGVPGPVSLAMQDNGNLVLFDATGTPRWSSASAAGVACPPPAGTLLCGPW